jgi:thiosulfate reductase cytochrome b subunit
MQAAKRTSASDPSGAHPITVRITHWVNAVAMIVMILSGWRIYNAAPVFDFSFPPGITLGGWLGGALLWHFGAMWVLVMNWLAYVVYGFASGHFQRRFLPITVEGVLRDLGLALTGRLDHDEPGYNFVQRLAYVGVMAAILVTILSGLVLWKPTQLQAIGLLMGGYPGARVVHFLGMAAIVAFLAVHIVLVAIVPRTLQAMLTGGTHAPSRPESKGARP